MPLNPVGNWYQQFMPDIGSRSIQDITFVDSLTGYVSARQTGDTSYILKTTNGGNNWQIIYRNFFAMTQIQFLNSGTGYACGACLFKTINGGLNWNQVTAPSISPEEFVSINEDTIWIISSEPFSGGVFRTTNGGAAWEHQFSGGTQNPDHIYMYNGRLGFMSRNGASPNIYRTTNSGVNWNIVVSGEYFRQMYFIDSLEGWRTKGDTLKHTTNGGLNWINNIMPYGGIIMSNVVTRFHVLSKDTLWGVGGYVRYPNNQERGIIYRSTNGGANWLFQVPDTNTVSFVVYRFINFTNKNHGWSYLDNTGGIHTSTGGDPIWITGIEQTNTEVPESFKLFQNYPNPFNAMTKLKFQMLKRGYAVLKLFDITGREVSVIVNESLDSGEYEVIFNADNFSSGVYFYKLTVTAGREVFTDTKKMIMIK